jgi:hypothetical protein
VVGHCQQEPRTDAQIHERTWPLAIFAQPCHDHHQDHRPETMGICWQSRKRRVLRLSVAQGGKRVVVLRRVLSVHRMSPAEGRVKHAPQMALPVPKTPLQEASFGKSGTPRAGHGRGIVARLEMNRTMEHNLPESMVLHDRYRDILDLYMKEIDQISGRAAAVLLITPGLSAVALQRVFLARLQMHVPPIMHRARSWHQQDSWIVLVGFRCGCLPGFCHCPV